MSINQSTLDNCWDAYKMILNGPGEKDAGPVSETRPGPGPVLDHLHYILNKSGPLLGIRPGPIYIIGPDPICHMGLAYNRQVCLQGGAGAPPIP